MKTYLNSMILITGLLAGAAFGDEIAPAARTAARHAAITICANCHGPQGHAINPKFPRLAGQRPGYLMAQLHGFKSRGRGDADAVAYMWGMAAPLQEDMIAALADYYAAQKPGPGAGGDAAAIERGRGLFHQGLATGVPACGTCHGEDAAGKADFPRLAGQSTQYLLKQLRAFNTNLRDAAVMHGVAVSLSDAQMHDVAAYLASLGP
ncbi:MAG: c-type cytochrome [Steroidobacteraceae bacterium]